MTAVIILILALGVTLGLLFVTICCLHDTQQECGRWRDGYSEARRRQADAERARDTYRLYADQARIVVGYRIHVDTTAYERAVEQVRRDIARFERGDR